MKQDFKKNFFLLSGLIVLMFFLVIFNHNNYLKPIIEPIHWVMKPFVSISSKTGFFLGDTWIFLKSIGQLKNENNFLFNENLKLKANVAGFQEIEKENEALRKSLELAPRAKYNLCSAMIIGRDISGNSDILYIDKGRADGLEKGMAVVVGEGILVGKLVAVNSHDAVVRLLISRESKINAEIEGGLAKGVIRGDYGTSVIMDMIPQSIELKPGMAITTSDLAENVPRGLLIGYIREALSSTDQLFQRAIIGLPVSFDQMRIVWIIRSVK